jgi:hypothetical protein
MAHVNGPFIAYNICPYLAINARTLLLPAVLQTPEDQLPVESEVRAMPATVSPPARCYTILLLLSVRVLVRDRRSDYGTKTRLRLRLDR